jgi:hypothetical protein
MGRSQVDLRNQADVNQWFEREAHPGPRVALHDAHKRRPEIGLPGVSGSNGLIRSVPSRESNGVLL